MPLGTGHFRVPFIGQRHLLTAQENPPGTTLIALDGISRYQFGTLPNFAKLYKDAADINAVPTESYLKVVEAPFAKVLRWIWGVSQWKLTGTISMTVVSHSITQSNTTLNGGDGFIYGGTVNQHALGCSGTFTFEATLAKLGHPTIASFQDGNLEYMLVHSISLFAQSTTFASSSGVGGSGDSSFTGSGVMPQFPGPTMVPQTWEGERVGPVVVNGSLLNLIIRNGSHAYNRATYGMRIPFRLELTVQLGTTWQWKHASVNGVDLGTPLPGSNPWPAFPISPWAGGPPIGSGGSIQFNLLPTGNGPVGDLTIDGEGPFPVRTPTAITPVTQNAEQYNQTFPGSGTYTNVSTQVGQAVTSVASFVLTPVKFFEYKNRAGQNVLNATTGAQENDPFVIPPGGG